MYPTVLNDRQDSCQAIEKTLAINLLARCVKLQARPARLDLDSQLLSFAILRSNISVINNLLCDSIANN